MNRLLRRTDTASKLIHAPPAALYRAFTTAGAMSAWLPPAGMSGRMLAFDFREGGGYRMQLTYDEPEHAPGKTSADSDEVEVRFTSLIPDRRIEQAVLFASDDPAYSQTMRIIWTFETAPEGARVTVRCENVPPVIRPEDHERGLRSSLDSLAAFAEAE